MSLPPKSRTFRVATAAPRRSGNRLTYHTDDSDDVRYTGAIFGVGVETRLAAGLYGRAEYLQSAFGQRNFDGGRYLQEQAGVRFHVESSPQ